MKKKTKSIIFVSFFALLLGVLVSQFLPNILLKASSYSNLSLIGKVIHYVKNEYIEPVRPEQTILNAIRGMLNFLDPISSYLDKDKLAIYQKLETSELADVGLVLTKRFGYPQIIGIIKDSPAENAPLKIGDYISSIDNVSTYEMSLWEARLSLKGQAGTKVRVKIMGNTSIKEVLIERIKLFMNSFTYQRTGKYGLLKIHYLYPGELVKIRQLITQALSQNIKGLIIDLRNCYEGKIEAGLKLANLFVKEGKFCFIKKKSGETQSFYGQKEQFLTDIPLVLFANQGTMSGAEIFSAILKKFGRAKIIGQPTLGLTSQQNLFLMEDDSAVLLTTGLIYLEPGEPIWGKGVKPDIDIKEEKEIKDPFLKKALAIISFR
ncbi:MAG: S41 family peptidase [Candidatus Aminicenantia bacterium]